ELLTVIVKVAVPFGLTVPALGVLTMVRFGQLTVIATGPAGELDTVVKFADADAVLLMEGQLAVVVALTTLTDTLAPDASVSGPQLSCSDPGLPLIEQLPAGLCVSIDQSVPAVGRLSVIVTPLAGP